jgi:HEAT repeat protein
MIRMMAVAVVSASLAHAANVVDTAWSIITQGINQTNSTKRKQAITGLECAGHVPRAVSVVENALGDKDVDVRQAAVSVLGAMRSKRSIPKLKAALQDPAPEVSFEAARALWALGDQSGRDILMAVAEGDRSNSSGLIKEQMRDAMKKLHNPAELAYMGVKEGAGAFLGPVGIGFMVLEELRKDGSAAARTISVSALANDSDPKTLQVLKDALQDKNWVVRAATAKALSTRGDPSALTKLEPLLQDKQEAVRYMASGAIIELDAISRKPARPQPREVRTQPTAAPRPVKR